MASRAGSARRALWRTVPDATADYSTSHLGRGADYDREFASPPHRALMWELEQRVLTTALAGSTARRVLDVGCGTGRITGLLAERLPRAEVCGADIAESMLAVARARVPSAHLVRADATDLAATLGPDAFDLVTAFRFFANADPPLRAAAVRELVTVLRPGGHLLLNNHRSFWSTSYVLRRSRRGAAAPGARNRDLLEPFLDRGLTVTGRWSLGVLPHSDERAYGFPLPVAARIERRNADVTAHLHTAGSNTIWMLRRDH